MSKCSAIVWRGLGYGLGAAVALVSAVTVLVLVITLTGQPAAGPFVLVYWLLFSAFGAVTAALPGLAVGAVLARAQERDPGAAGCGRAALTAGGTFFLQVEVAQVASNSHGWTASATLGSAVAALMAALCARRIVGGRRVGRCGAPAGAS
ncbi:hypothetical protein [Streptomyces sp. 1331.2]|uniref:hypothetical protein n=1 Tax=Streptomyces sp. 1331.2 TaxID=1938835 RepID=UPI000BDB64A7|nr:hypothetical protein [Streptomyces sp. 1331.2]SOB88810.1 hypothetical protein SAMN06272789_7124 [Streptomyces sp. 1331.2]